MQTIPEASTEPSISYIGVIGYQTGSCGYCKSPDQSVSYYAASKDLSVEHYQILVDRGWRRSGTLFYKPDLRHSCCPHYTIRLPAADFKPRKDQRQAVNRWNRYVLGDDYEKNLEKLRPKTKADKARARNGFDLTDAIHESEYDKLEDPHPEPTHKFEVSLESNAFTEEKFKLYENYQKHVHNDPPERITRSGFTRFLCDSPLRDRRTRNNEHDAKKFGSFHQCYRLDGRLMAMSVLDLLPRCVSGVYFVYHSDYEKYSLGKISALREATLALEGSYQFYYMGYYIHSCEKMRYKNDYKPQHVLDLETMQWHELNDDVRKLMDENHYMSVSLAMADGAISNSRSDRKVYDTAVDAVAAYDNGLSLFEINFAGMMTANELCEEVDLDEMRVRIKRNHVVSCKDFVKWEEWSIHDNGDSFSIKGAVAQLVACIGPELAKEVVVSFSG